MSDPVQHLKQSERTLVPWRVRILTWLLGVRFALYFYDWWQMAVAGDIRQRQLKRDTLHCRFCENEIPLLGSWKCECGYTRPGNYYGRCPKCLWHPSYIDCPSCGFTMYVR